MRAALPGSPPLSVLLARTGGQPSLSHSLRDRTKPVWSLGLGPSARSLCPLLHLVLLSQVPETSQPTRTKPIFGTCCIFHRQTTTSPRGDLGATESLAPPPPARPLVSFPFATGCSGGWDAGEAGRDEKRLSDRLSCAFYSLEKEKVTAAGRSARAPPLTKMAAARPVGSVPSRNVPLGKAGQRGRALGSHTARASAVPSRSLCPGTTSINQKPTLPGAPRIGRGAGGPEPGKARRRHVLLRQRPSHRCSFPLYATLGAFGLVAATRFVAPPTVFTEPAALCRRPPARRRLVPPRRRPSFP